MLSYSTKLELTVLMLMIVALVFWNICFNFFKTVDVNYILFSENKGTG